MKRVTMNKKEQEMFNKVDHSDKKALNKLTEKLSFLAKQSKSATPRKGRNSKETNKIGGSTPVAGRLRKRKVDHDHPKLDEFLRSKGLFISEEKEPVRNKRFNTLGGQIENIGKDNPEKKKRSSNRKNKPSTDSNQQKMDTFLIKRPNTQNKAKKLSEKAVKRTDSSDSCDLPTFKSKRKPKMNKKDRESFIKYGVLMPSVDEILKDQIDLEKYKTKVESFKQMCDKSFELPFSVKDLNRSPINEPVVLDCKELSLEDISEQFSSNLQYISDIYHGRIYNERHDRYHSVSNKVPTLTTRDLSYNTSMILFTFEQKEHMLSLLEKEFDPKCIMTQYFFQVLLPELCLKIFMDTHKMNQKDAVLYLDKRPVVGD